MNKVLNLRGVIRDVDYYPMVRSARLRRYAYEDFDSH